MMAQIPVTGQLPTDMLVGSQFFTYALPWLLTFAIVYGFLQHYKIPQSKSARGVISIVLAFFVMPIAAPVMAFIRQIGASMMVIVTGIIFFLVLLELTRTKLGAHGEGVMEGAEEERRGVIEEHTKTFGVIVLVILVLIFWGAGGFKAVGLGNMIPMVNWPTLFFLGIMALAVWFMAGREE